MNANGKWDQALEPGWAGVTVTLTDDEGRSVTGVTQADGTVKLSPGTALSGGKYRIEVKNPDAKVYFPGAASARTDLTDPRVLSSNVEFVDLSAGKNVEVTTSFWSPEDYCQKNATLAAVCQNADIPTAAPPTKRTLSTFTFNTRGDAVANPALVTDQATEADTGTMWGLGYNKVTKQLFTSAYAKRGTKYGPGGPGAIYRTNPATGGTTLFTQVPNPGTTAHTPGTDMDLAFNPVVGKESLGDLDVSPDGKDLYVVNLHDRRLYRYDATQATAAAPKASYSIPDPGCAANSDWRPFGLGIQDGKVYVGGVCSAQSTGNKADLRAVVRQFDPVTGQFTNTVMDQPMTYPHYGWVPPRTDFCAAHTWYPWSNIRPATQDGLTCPPGSILNPEPELSDIDFETNGDMVVSFADRFVDRAGWNLPGFPGFPATTALNAGDINRACRGGNHMFILDANGGCKNNATLATNGGLQPLDVREYYPGDHYPTAATGGVSWHDETAEGSVALDKVETSLPMVAEDPIADPVTGHGVQWLDRTTGARVNETDNSGGLYLNQGFGKARGIGDMEVLCDQAPLQLGNRVWQDTNENGIQDPGEAPVAGATVNLYDANGNKIGTAVTNSRGEYYFDSTVTKNVSAADLVYGRTYTIKMDNPDDYAAGGVLQGWVPTRPNQGDDDQIDSSGEPDGNPFPAVVVNPAGAGQNDHGADFGFKKPSVDLSIIKVGPAKVDPAGEVVYNLIVTNNGPNDSSGWTVTDPLPAGMLNPHTSDAGCGIGAGTLTCTGGPLKVGESHTITVRGLAPATGPAKLDNCATVKGNEQDPNMQNNNSCVTTDIPGIPLTDPGIAAAFAVLTGLGTAYYRRRRHTTGAAL
ncbi:SdrD B-like domain-containing protein [Streptomyces sp. L2]|uniref:SdrD B-like domain-containing protein n=1 Tax=Streptomyces sp. L2 TaxID=2162665 RepID=UPI0010117CE9|nr:SdrD B-like domain-containing protein [Streptomyces sp. L2]